MHRDPLARLAALRSSILALRAEAHSILGKLAAEFSEDASPAPARAAAKTPAVSSKPVAAKAVKAARGKGRGRRSPSGPLRLAVVRLLAGAGRSMRVAEIFEGLKASGYQFTGNDPKKTLGVSIYSMAGVKRVGDGLFVAESGAAPAAPATPATA